MSWSVWKYIMEKRISIMLWHKPFFFAIRFFFTFKQDIFTQTYVIARNFSCYNNINLILHTVHITVSSTVLTNSRISPRLNPRVKCDLTKSCKSCKLFLSLSVLRTVSSFKHVFHLITHQYKRSCSSHYSKITCHVILQNILCYNNNLSWPITR